MKENILEQFKQSTFDVNVAKYTTLINKAQVDALTADKEFIVVTQGKPGKFQASSDTVKEKQRWSKRIITKNNVFSPVKEIEMIENYDKNSTKDTNNGNYSCGDMNMVLFEKYKEVSYMDGYSETPIKFDYYLSPLDVVDFNVTRLGNIPVEHLLTLLADDTVVQDIIKLSTTPSKSDIFVELFFKGREKDDSRAKVISAVKVTTKEVFSQCRKALANENAATLLSNFLCSVLEEKGLLYMEDVNTIVRKRLVNDSFTCFKNAMNIANIFINDPFKVQIEKKNLIIKDRIQRRDIVNLFDTVLNSLGDAFQFQLTWKEDLQVLFSLLHLVYHPHLANLEVNVGIKENLKHPVVQELSKIINFYFWSEFYQKNKGKADIEKIGLSDVEKRLDRVNKYMDVITKEKGGVGLYNKMTLETYRSFFDINHHNSSLKSYVTVTMNRDIPSSSFAGQKFDSTILDTKYNSLLVDEDLSIAYNIHLPQIIKSIQTNKFHNLAADTINPFSNAGLLITNVSTIGLCALAASFSRTSIFHKREVVPNESDITSQDNNNSKKDKGDKEDPKQTVDKPNFSGCLMFTYVGDIKDYVSPNLIDDTIKTFSPFEVMLAVNDVYSSKAYQIRVNNITSGYYILDNKSKVLTNYRYKEYKLKYQEYQMGKGKDLEKKEIPYIVSMVDIFEKGNLYLEETAFFRHLSSQFSLHYLLPMSIANFMYQNMDKINNIQLESTGNPEDVDDDNRIFGIPNFIDKNLSMFEFQGNLAANAYNLPLYIRDYISDLTTKTASIPLVQRVVNIILQGLLAKDFEENKGKLLYYQSSSYAKFKSYAELIATFIVLHSFGIIEDEQLKSFIMFIQTTDLIRLRTNTIKQPIKTNS